MSMYQKAHVQKCPVPKQPAPNSSIDSWKMWVITVTDYRKTNGVFANVSAHAYSGRVNTCLDGYVIPRGLNVGAQQDGSEPVAHRAPGGCYKFADNQTVSKRRPSADSVANLAKWPPGAEGTRHLAHSVGVLLNGAQFLLLLLPWKWHLALRPFATDNYKTTKNKNR